MAQINPQRIVDAHIHWFRKDNPYKHDHGRDYLPDDYLEDAAGYNVIGIVHIEAHWNPKDRVGETRWVRSLATGGSDRGLLKGIVGEANISSDDVERELEGHAADRSARSIRHVVNYLPGSHANWWADQGYKAKPGWVRSQDYFENPKFLANFHKLARYGLGFDYMAFPNHMKPMAKLANANPGVTVYVEHTGMPYDHTAEGLAVWREGMRALATAPNVVCKLSGLGNTVPRRTEGFDPSLRPGSDRHLRNRPLHVCIQLSDRRRLQHDAGSVGGVLLDREDIHRWRARQALCRQRDQPLSPRHLMPVGPWRNRR